MKKYILFSFFTSLAVLAIAITTFVRDPNIASQSGSQAQTLRSMTLQEIQEALKAVLEQVLAIQRALQGILGARPENSGGASPSVSPVASASPQTSTIVATNPISSPSLSIKPLPELILYYKVDPKNTLIREGTVDSFANLTISDKADLSMSHNICAGGTVRLYFTTNINLTGVEVKYDGASLGHVKSEGKVGKEGTLITLPKNNSSSCTYILPLSLVNVMYPLPAHANIRMSIEPVELKGVGNQTYPLYSTSKTALDTVYFGQ